jgi:hypothetical protein
MVSRRGGRIEPLALILLLAFVILPPALMFGPQLVRWAEGPPVPRYLVESLTPRVAGAAPPTKGMTVSRAGFGTVLSAPRLVVAMADRPPPPTDAAVGEDVARWVRSWVRIVPNPAIDPSAPQMCAWEGGARRGRIILRDGCLRFQANNGSAGAALLPTNATLFRDKEGYLAIGDPMGPRQFQVRIGEPDAIVATGSCTFPDTVAPPPAHRKACGADAMLVATTIERRPVCSAAYLAERARIEREEQATAARVKAEADACHASGRKTCPPGVIPRSPPLTDESAPCRLPAG